MFVRIISVFFDPGTGQFDDGEVHAFLKDKDVIAISDHFFTRGDVPYLILVIKYSLHQRKDMDSKPVGQKQRDESWRENLSESEVKVFNLLREWRTKRSQMEAVPPYILFTNKQLADVVKRKPKALSDLECVEGVGRAKVEKYGQDILGITNTSSSEDGLSEPLNP